jgi:hypothetical protein
VLDGLPWLMPVCVCVHYFFDVLNPFSSWFPLNLILNVILNLIKLDHEPDLEPDQTCLNLILNLIKPA